MANQKERTITTQLVINEDQAVITVNYGGVAPFSRTIKVVGVTDVDIDSLKQLVNDEALDKFYNSSSIIERVYNIVALDERGAELVSVNEIIDWLKAEIKPESLDRQVRQILWELFGDDESEYESDLLRQCVDHIINVLEFMGVFMAVYYPPYGEDHLGTTAGASLDLVGRAIFEVLYGCKDNVVLE